MISAQFLRFGVAGAIGFVVDSLVLLAMTQVFGFSPYVGRAVSFSTALTTTWLINRAWAFRQEGGKSPRELLAEYLNYWAVQMTGGAVNLAAFAIFVAIFGETGLSQVAGVAAGSVAGMFVNYFGNKALVFGAGETVARVQRWTQRTVWIALGTLVLLIPAMLIGEAGAGAEAGSALHSQFLSLTSASLGPWAPAAFQAAAGAWMIALASGEFGRSFRGGPYLALAAALTGLTTVGYLAGLPMPDIFAGYFLLAAVLFLAGARVNRLEQAGLWLLMALSAAFLPTLTLLAGAIALVGVAVLWARGRKPAAALALGGLVLLAGVPGLVGGQALDMASNDRQLGWPPFVPGFGLGVWDWVAPIAFYLSLVLALAFTAVSIRRPRSQAERQFAAAILIAVPVLIACNAIWRLPRLEWVLPALVLAGLPVMWARLRKHES